MPHLLNWTELFKDLVGMFAILNPLGAIPIYLTMTAHKSTGEMRHIAAKTSIAVGVILIISLWGGNLLLQFFGIGMPAFRIASGLLVLLIAISMFQAKISPAIHTHAEALEAEDKEGIAVVPLAIPLLAGPGAISLVIVNAEQMSYWADKLIISLGSIFLAGVVWIILSLAVPLGKRLGTAGINIATRIMGLLLAAMAVQFIANGLIVLFPGWTRL
ncbi:MAG: MarC family protein [Methylococcaceae bacterium]|jgi:multiple antibiotic resistance protein|nr:MarC family protein [Methylococcaceae bacterium]MDZ4155631.1 MarC family protein [Methylococcales bacterium]MDP2392233.1 MarC family protein [Methylococcaceae bacterium]MDP3018235.1 MarC family protein [Methylococcaceae bacterium]MDP3389878.1 MarC family protein [Methylococcaceae bacterium]